MKKLFVWLLRPVVDHIIRERESDIKKASESLSPFKNDKTYQKAEKRTIGQIRAKMKENGSKYQI